MNLPNSITLVRLLLTVVFCIAATMGGVCGYGIALAAFAVGALSDWLDGFLARKLNLVTSLGKLLDPLADKVLVCAGFVFLTAEGLCPAWITAVIMCREFLVTGIRQIAVEKGVVIAADHLGKWKTTFQLAFIMTALTHLTFAPLENDFWLVNRLKFLSNPDQWLFPLSLWGAVLLTVVSGYSYFAKSKDMLLDRD